MKVTITKDGDGSITVEYPDSDGGTQTLDTKEDGQLDAGDLATILISCGISVQCDLPEAA